jgi:hypothetical protein
LGRGQSRRGAHRGKQTAGNAAIAATKNTRAESKKIAVKVFKNKFDKV